MTIAPGSAAANASLRRRLASLVYETLILAAVLLAGSLPVVVLTRTWEQSHARLALQLWLVVVCGCFYVWQWAGVGQTLPMKTWKLKLVAMDESPVNFRRAILRYLGALASVATLGLGFLWALVDRQGHFLHDRLAGTKLVVSPG